MGTFMQSFTLTGPTGTSETFSGLVDTGSTFTTVPGRALRALGVTPFARIRLRLANGQPTDADVGEIAAQIEDLPRRTIICVFGEDESPPLLGAHALEAFLLGVDPDQRRLVSLEAWWT